MDHNGTFVNIYGQVTDYNATLYNKTNLCTTHTCPLDWADIHYIPSGGGNGFYLAIFTICLIAQVVLGIMYRTWPFLAAWTVGLALEIGGYAGRELMHANVFDTNAFLLYLVCLTIAPAFLTGGIYLCLSRIIVVYGEHLARFRPKTYTIIFVCSDVFALVLQAIGGAMADIGDRGSSLQQSGLNLMIAGLVFQVVSLAIFISLCLDFAWRVRSRGVSSRSTLRLFDCSPGRFHLFIMALATAVITIFVRSVFRVAELKSGFSGKLANQQVTFMLLEGAMVSLAALSLTIMHPGPIFKGFWKIDQARTRIRGTSYVEDHDPERIVMTGQKAGKGMSA